MFYYFGGYFHALHIFILLLFYFFYWNLAVFINCYLNIKLTYGTFKDVEAGSLNYLLVQFVPSINHSIGKKMFPTVGVQSAPHFS